MCVHYNVLISIDLGPPLKRVPRHEGTLFKLWQRYLQQRRFETDTLAAGASSRGFLLAGQLRMLGDVVCDFLIIMDFRHSCDQAHEKRLPRHLSGPWSSVLDLF